MLGRHAGGILFGEIFLIPIQTRWLFIGLSVGVITKRRGLCPANRKCQPANQIYEGTIILSYVYGNV